MQSSDNSLYFIFNSPSFSQFLAEHPHERGEVEFLKSIAEEGMIAVEIGGYAGMTTVAIAKALGEKGIVYCFEPIPEYRKLLEKNLLVNNIENVKIFPYAVLDKKGEEVFYINGGATSFIPQENTEKITVKTISLDTFLEEHRMEKIDLLHMDCEGSELLVLKGAEKTLRKNKVKIFCEIHHDFLSKISQSVWDIVNYLKNLGYKVKAVKLDDLTLHEDFQTCEYIYATSPPL